VALASAVTASPDASLIRAAALAVTSWGESAMSTAVTGARQVGVPGFPRTALDDEAWSGSWPDAVELGGAAEGFWDRIATHGLLLPASWVPHGWASLWSRANR
jgi:hypothetical protein